MVQDKRPRVTGAVVAGIPTLVDMVSLFVRMIGLGADRPPVVDGLAGEVLATHAHGL